MTARSQAAVVAFVSAAVVAAGVGVGKALDRAGPSGAAAPTTATTDEPETTVPATTTTVAPTSTTTTAPVGVPADMLNPAVTQATIATTICVQGWTATVRPPLSYTEPIKRLQVASYGYSDRRLASYELDHMVPLELGGAPSAKVNLWPQPHATSVPDDGLENSLRAQVCAGKLTLDAARQSMFATKVAHGYDRAKSTV